MYYTEFREELKPFPNFSIQEIEAWCWRSAEINSTLSMEKLEWSIVY